jgi:hypothetical protein
MGVSLGFKATQKANRRRRLQRPRSGRKTCINKAQQSSFLIMVIIYQENVRAKNPVFVITNYRSVKKNAPE